MSVDDTKEDFEDRIAKVKIEIESLKEKIIAKKNSLDDINLKTFSKEIPSLLNSDKFKLRRTLQGHRAKIYTLQWSSNSSRLVSASQEGILIVWNALTTNKYFGVPLKNPWVMSCGYAPSGKFVSSGGLDNICSIFSIENTDPMNNQPVRELIGHKGFLSGCKFLSDSEIITSSADKTCILWDIEKGAKINIFNDHKGEILSISLNPIDGSTFLSASTDSTTKLWDIRKKKCIQTFQAHKSDVNAVCFFPNGMAFGTGGEDHSCRLFDIRADRELMTYVNSSLSFAITSVAFSISGRYLISGDDEYSCHIWDTLKGEKLNVLQGHKNRVSCVGVSYDGNAICTGSWDSTLKIWA